MSDLRVNGNIFKIVLKYLHVLQNSEGNKLSLEAIKLYSHLYSTYRLFGSKFLIDKNQLISERHCKKCKFYDVLAELQAFGLIYRFHETISNGTRKIPNILHISLLPPQPLVFLNATISATDFSGNLIPVCDVSTMGKDAEELVLKHRFIYLGNNHPHKELLRELDTHDVIYFVAEPMQLEDGRWELKNIFNLTTKIEGV